jgi:undecaprenyl-diphosphatase
VQIGAITAVLVYFWADLVRLARAGLGGVRSAEGRRDPDWPMAWSVAVGSIPIGIVGFASRDLIEGPLRSLYVVAAALILWSFVMLAAERYAAKREGSDRARPRGPCSSSASCRASPSSRACRARARRSAPGSSSAWTASWRRSSRSTSRSPPSSGPGCTSCRRRWDDGVGLVPTLVGSIVAFFVAYASIAWLLRFVAGHPISWFVPYRIVLGVVILVVLALGGG